MECVHSAYTIYFVCLTKKLEIKQNMPLTLKPWNQHTYILLFNI